MRFARSIAPLAVAVMARAPLAAELGVPGPARRSKSREEELHVEHVEPAPLLEAGFAQTADRGEAVPGVQGDAGGLIRGDPGDDRVVAALSCGFDEARQQDAADAAEAPLRGEVDGALHGPAVAAARVVDREARPADHPLGLGDEDRVIGVVLVEPGDPLLQRLGLERPGAGVGGDVVVVDVADRGAVRAPGGAQGDGRCGIRHRVLPSADDHCTPRTGSVVKVLSFTLPFTNWIEIVPSGPSQVALVAERPPSEKLEVSVGSPRIAMTSASGMSSSIFAKCARSTRGAQATRQSARSDAAPRRGPVTGSGLEGLGDRVEDLLLLGRDPGDAEDAAARLRDLARAAQELVAHLAPLARVEPRGEVLRVGEPDLAAGLGRPIGHRRLERLVAGAAGEDPLAGGGGEDRVALGLVELAVGPGDLDERIEREGGHRLAAHLERDQALEDVRIGDAGRRLELLPRHLLLEGRAQLVEELLILALEEFRLECPLPPMQRVLGHPPPSLAWPRGVASA